MERDAVEGGVEPQVRVKLVVRAVELRAADGSWVVSLAEQEISEEIHCRLSSFAAHASS